MTNADTYFSDLINVRKHARSSLRSNSGNILLHPAGKMRKSFGDRSFSVAAPTMWNVLSASLRSVDSILTFKSCLTTYLFKLAFICLFIYFFLVIFFLLIKDTKVKKNYINRRKKKEYTTVWW